MFLSEELLAQIHQRAAQYDLENAWPKEDYEALKEAGYYKAFVPKEYGDMVYLFKKLHKNKQD